MTWPLARLGDLATKVTSGSTPSGGSTTYLTTGPVMLVRSQNVRMNQLDLSDVAFITEEVDASMDRSRVEYDDVLLNITGASIGRVARFDRRERANVNQHVCIIRSKQDRLCPRYLTLLISSPPFQRNIDRLQHGGTRQALTFELIKDFEIPLPPLTEQKRIAAVLDKADELRGKRRQALATLDTLLQSVFLDMFGDPVTNPKKWPKMTFEDVAPSRLGKMLDAKQQTGDHGRPYLRNISVQWDRFDLGDVQTMDFDDDDREEFILKVGDLMICEGGEPGRCAIWRNELPECYFQKALHRARPHPTKATPEYLLYLMWSLADRGGFKDHVTVATIAHLTGEKLKRMLVPVPPVVLQRKFAAMYAKVRARRTSLAAAEESTDALFATLQSAAFAGTLFNGEMVKAAASEPARQTARPANSAAV